MKDIDRTEYFKQRDELLKKFSSEFAELCYTDPMARTVFELLHREANPYKIIEDLLKDRIKIIKEMQNYIMQNPKGLVIFREN